MHDRQKPTHLPALVLRLAVAGVLIAAAGGHLVPPAEPLRTDVPQTAEVEPTMLEIPEAIADPGIESVIQSGDASASLDENELRVSFGSLGLLGWCQYGFAAALVLGLFTRWAALAGLGAVTTSALSAFGAAPDGSWTARLAELYTANPAAALLLGAICLALLVSGSGPMACDRRLQKRKARRAEGAPTAPAS